MHQVLSIEWVKHCGLLLAVASVLTGCQGTLLTTHKGAKVRDSALISLADGIQRSAHYQSSDLIIDYRMFRNGNELRLSGTAKYTPRIQHGYQEIPFFYLNVFLTDINGVILKDSEIATPYSDDPQKPMPFNQTIELPPGAAYMAFNYNIEAISECNREQTSFWDLPIVR